MWCLANSKTPHLRNFTLDFLHYKDAKSFPFTNTKGSDTMLLLEWLQVELALALRRLQGHQLANLLCVGRETCRASCSVFRHVYNHGLWLPRKCMASLRDELLRVVRGYSSLACQCHDAAFPAFRYKSTIHSLHHFATDLCVWLQMGARCCPNPLLFDCSQPEDFIGRIARVARATHGKTVAQRSLQRHLVKAKGLMKRTLRKASASKG